MLVKKNLDSNHDNGNQEQAPIKTEETQQISVSLPDMVTTSQFNNQITRIVEPIKRERTTKEEITKRNNMVSKLIFKFGCQEILLVTIVTNSTIR